MSLSLELMPSDSITSVPAATCEVVRSTRDTAPELTEKSAEAKEATPLLESVASSAATVTVRLPELEAIVVSMPSPPTTVKFFPGSSFVAVPESAPTSLSPPVPSFPLVVFPPYAIIECSIYLRQHKPALQPHIQ